MKLFHGVSVIYEMVKNLNYITTRGKFRKQALCR